MLPEVGSTIVPPGSELPLPLGRLDHRHPDPVLVRAARVQVLELREQRRLHVAGDPVEPDDRRLADEVEQGGVLAGHAQEPTQSVLSRSLDQRSRRYRRELARHLLDLRLRLGIDEARTQVERRHAQSRFAELLNLSRE